MTIRRAGIVTIVALVLVTLGLPALAADWRTTMGVFRIGFADGPAAPTSPEREKLRAAFAAALSMPVEIVMARSQPDLMDAHTGGRIDYAVYSAAGYAAAWRSCSCLQPLVSPTGADGSTGVRSVLVMRAGRTEKDLAGKRVAAGPGDMLHALIPWKSETATGSAAPLVEQAPAMSAAEALFVEGGAEGLYGWAPYTPGREPRGGTLERLRAMPGGEDAAIVRESEPVRYGPHAVRNTIDPEARRLLVQFLTGLAQADPEAYGALEPRLGGGFVAVAQSDYASAVRLVEAVAGAE